MPNTNCLAGFQCPNEECRSEGPFYIDAVVLTTVLVSDSGVIEEEGGSDTAWRDTSHCRCFNCGHEGKVKEFNP